VTIGFPQNVSVFSGSGSFQQMPIRKSSMKVEQSRKIIILTKNLLKLVWKINNKILDVWFLVDLAWNYPFSYLKTEKKS
jgi:hypothetical protein